MVGAAGGRKGYGGGAFKGLYGVHDSILSQSSPLCQIPPILTTLSYASPTFFQAECFELAASRTIFLLDSSNHSPRMMNQVRLWSHLIPPI